MNKLYQNIRERRKALGLTHDQLAEKLGYKARQSIMQIEKGQVDLPLSKIHDFARALNTTVRELIGLDGIEEDVGSEQLRILAKRLRKNDFDAEVFSTIAEASDYIARKCEGKTVGVGDSSTFTQMGLIDKIRGKVPDKNLFITDIHKSRTNGKKAMTADIFILSINAISYETGEFVNISHKGSRIAGSLHYSDEIILIAGKNKITSNLAEAMDRIRNVTAPRAAKEHKFRTPCVKSGKCEECSSSERFCRITCIYHRKPELTNMMVILIDEDLGR